MHPNNKPSSVLVILSAVLSKTILKLKCSSCISVFLYISANDWQNIFRRSGLIHNMKIAKWIFVSSHKEYVLFCHMFFRYHKNRKKICWGFHSTLWIEVNFLFILLTLLVILKTIPHDSKLHPPKHLFKELLS